MQSFRMIMQVFENNPSALFGITNLEYSDYKANYKCALVVAIPYARRPSLEDYNEEEFEGLIREARKRSIGIINEIAVFLKQNGIRYYIPAPSQTSEEELVALFSFKYAAVNAGLGWIGKNDVLVTEQYGPEVSLNAILIDYDLPYVELTKECKCPPGCDLCINACPYHALQGNIWTVDSKRSDLIDYQLCNQKRSLYKKRHGRKHSCGLCMAACPVGLKG